MFPCERVDLGFLETAPHRFRNTVELAVTAEQLFETFADAESWRHWDTPIAEATWTSPEPHGVGATRIVKMRTGTLADEVFLTWEPHRRMTFRFNSCSTQTFAALAEDFQIEPIPGGCRLTWTLAITLAGPVRLLVLLVGPLVNVVLRRILKNLRRYADERFAAHR